MGVGPIPFTAIAEYFTIYGIDGDFHEFASIIRRMDNVFLELNAQEMKASSKKGDAKSGSSDANKKTHHQG